jgi:hypothetical protein
MTTSIGEIALGFISIMFLIGLVKLVGKISSSGSAPVKQKEDFLLPGMGGFYFNYPDGGLAPPMNTQLFGNLFISQVATKICLASIGNMTKRNGSLSIPFSKKIKSSSSIYLGFVLSFSIGIILAHLRMQHKISEDEQKKLMDGVRSGLSQAMKVSNTDNWIGSVIKQSGNYAMSIEISSATGDRLSESVFFDIMSAYEMMESDSDYITDSMMLHLEVGNILSETMKVIETANLKYKPA